MTWVDTVAVHFDSIYKYMDQGMKLKNYMYASIDVCFRITVCVCIHTCITQLISIKGAQTYCIINEVVPGGCQSTCM